jgi:hypothetical protein
VNDERLPAAIEAAALVRRTAAQGDFAAILKKGDPDRGTLLLIVSSRGEHCACLQRALDLKSNFYVWRRIGPERPESSEGIRNFLEQQARFDADSWQIELDVAQPERFIAETTGSA